MERKHIAEEINFDLKELFEICSDVICQSDEEEDVRGVLKVAKALIMNTSYSDGNHFSEEEKLYELADEFLGDFTKKTALSNYTILMMLSIRGERKLSFCLQCEAQTIGRYSSDRSERGNVARTFSMSG